jgi:hypothetical protein
MSEQIITVITEQSGHRLRHRLELVATSARRTETETGRATSDDPRSEEVRCGGLLAAGAWPLHGHGVVAVMRAFAFARAAAPSTATSLSSELGFSLKVSTFSGGQKHLFFEGPKAHRLFRETKSA